MRLTKKSDRDYTGYEPVEELVKKNNASPIIGKLGQLEDVEEEFEIDNIEDLRDRLTKYKFLANHEMSCVDANAYNLMLEDLDKYHSIEEQLGVDLVTLFKAISNGVWVKTKNGISQHFTVSLRKWLQTNKYCLYYRPYTHIWFEDYGKTWALTKEELEK